VNSRRRDVLPFLLLLLGAVACPPRPVTSPLAGYDLILINIDALRADHLGCYGYSRDTSPFLDSLCRESVVFERASAASSYTRESVAALFSGRLPSKSGALGWRAAPRAPHLTLAERLRARGFRTGSLSNTVMLRDPGFARGFDTAQHLPKHWNLSGEGPRLSDAALDFVRETAPQRFFLYLHYLDPHGPYEPAPDFHRRLAPRPSPSPLALYDDVTPNLPALRADGFGPSDPQFEDLVTRYDAEIAANDAAVQRLFRGLAKLGGLDRALVVITADHGEEFLEHDFVEHGWTLYEESLRVPLIFWAPGAIQPARIKTRASHVDLVPTLLDLLGVPDGGSKVDGVPLFEIGPDGLRPVSRERVQIAELLLARRQIVRALLLDDWKYLAAWRWVDPSERASGHERSPGAAPDLWGPPLREELFHLGEDPGERRNRIDANPDVHRELAAALERFHSAGPNYGFAPTGSAGEPDAGEIPSDDTERLRALGYRE